MPERDLGDRPSGDAQGHAVLGDAILGDAVLGDAVLGDAVLGDAVLGDIRPYASALRASSDRAVVEADAAGTGDELAHDFAEIERAAAMLRQAEPTLEMWTESWPGKRTAAMRNPRPVWLLIGLLWLSTALVTAGAVAAIAHLAG